MQARVGALSLGNRSLSVVYALPLPCPGVPSQNAQDAQAQVAQVSDVPGASDAYVHDLGIGTAGHVKQVTLLDQSVFDAYAILGARVLPKAICIHVARPAEPSS